MDIKNLPDTDLANLIENRWKSSETVWDGVTKTYPINLRYYKGSPEWLDQLPRRQPKVRNNRIFVNTEAVINSLIANLPKPTIISGSDSPNSRELAAAQERYYARKYDDLNVKETMRKGLRNLYFGRLIVLKPFWDSKINDFNVRALDPRKIRVQKNSTKEQDSEFVIEEVDDTVLSILRRFPDKKDEIMTQAGYTDDTKLFVDNPNATYKEAWIRDYVVFKYQNLILDKLPNPYWDWDGVQLTEDEENQLSYAVGEQRRNILQNAKQQQPQRKQAMVQAISAAQAQPQQDPNSPAPQGVPAAPQQPQQDPAQKADPVDIPEGTLPLTEFQDTPITYKAYYFNHFDQPRKPYIFATAFNNENTPIGQTDMITQAIPLQVDADETKRNITRNARFVNGVWKIDANVMGKSDAQRLDTEVGGIIWGKGVKDGATRETGTPLPSFVFQNYQDNLNEIDNIMAASSAFRGEAEGNNQTKGGILALIDQTALRLNELVQIVDYVNYELFNWFYQLSKVRYTEHHEAKIMGKDNATETLTIVQDDLLDGTEVHVISGKTLPEDRQFKYAQAQADVKEGLISPIRYLEEAGYENPQQTSKDAYLYRVNPQGALGLTDQEKQGIPPPLPQTQLREQVAFADLPDAAKPQFLARMGITVQPQDVETVGDAPISIAFKDLPLDGQIQAAAKAGITLDPKVIVAEAISEKKSQQQDQAIKQQAAIKPEPAAPTNNK